MRTCTGTQVHTGNFHNLAWTLKTIDCVIAVQTNQDDPSSPLHAKCTQRDWLV